MLNRRLCISFDRGGNNVPPLNNGDVNSKRLIPLSQRRRSSWCGSSSDAYKAKQLQAISTKCITVIRKLPGTDSQNIDVDKDAECNSKQVTIPVNETHPSAVDTDRVDTTISTSTQSQTSSGLLRSPPRALQSSGVHSQKFSQPASSLQSHASDGGRRPVTAERLRRKSEHIQGVSPLRSCSVECDLVTQVMAKERIMHEDRERRSNSIQLAMNKLSSNPSLDGAESPQSLGDYHEQWQMNKFEHWPKPYTEDSTDRWTSKQAPSSALMNSDRSRRPRRSSVPPQFPLSVADALPPRKHNSPILRLGSMSDRLCHRQGAAVPTGTVRQHRKSFGQPSSAESAKRSPRNLKHSTFRGGTADSLELLCADLLTHAWAREAEWFFKPAL